MAQKDVVLKNNVLFTSCIAKISSIFVDNAEDLDVVIPLYNLLEYSDNYSITSGSLWNYFQDMKLMILVMMLQTVNNRKKKSTTFKHRSCYYIQTFK